MKYICKKGDSFTKLGQELEIDVEILKGTNGDIQRLKAGLEIEIPDAKIKEDVVEEKEPICNLKIQSKTGSDVNLREEPSLNSKVLEVLKNGFEFVGERDGEWIRYNDGFVLGELVLEI